MNTIDRRIFVKGGLAAAAFGAILLAGPGVRPAFAEGADLGDLVLGSPDAPVTVIEYASLTCPHCAHFHTAILPAVKEKYLDTGKVKILFRDYPIGDAALVGAMAARCGGEKKRKGFVELFFKQQADWTAARNVDELFAGIAQILKFGGVSREQFDACLKDTALYQAVIDQQKIGSEQFGVNSTPSFVIDGKTHPGALPLEDFSALVDPLIN